MQTLLTDEITIIADSLEENIIHELKKIKNCKVVEKRLEVGDFIISERICIERKKARDFVKSIIDGRLFRQVKELKENFENPVIIIEGNNFKGIHPNAIRGALATLAVDFSIPIIWTKNSEDTALTIYLLAKREQKEKRNRVGIKGHKKARTMDDFVINILCSFPGIGPEKAKNLIQRFGTLRNIFLAEESELKTVPGIGKKLAEDIKKILDYRKKDNKATC